MPAPIGHTLLRSPFLEEWSARHEDLSAARDLAFLFRGWSPPGFKSSHARVLYIGKATSGEYSDANGEEKFFNGKGAFWSFAREIAVAVGIDTTDLRGLAWSNISKLALQQITADPSLIWGSEGLASETLEDEIKQLRPHAVVFVTAHFSDEVVARVAQTYEDADWYKSEERSSETDHADIWWRFRDDGIAVISMRHPMTAKRTHRAHAAMLIANAVEKAKMTF